MTHHMRFCDGKPTYIGAYNHISCGRVKYCKGDLTCHSKFCSQNTLFRMTYLVIQGQAIIFEGLYITIEESDETFVAIYKFH